MTEKLNGYNTVMTTVIDKHAPVINKTIRIKPNAPWFDAEYAALRRQRRKAEKKFWKTHSLVDGENTNYIAGTNKKGIIYN